MVPATSAKISHRASGARHPLHKEAIYAAFALAAGMGFGRFAFTGMAPVMLSEGQLSIADGSLAASANYIGYLIGALVAGAVNGSNRQCGAASRCSAR